MSWYTSSCCGGMIWLSFPRTKLLKGGEAPLDTCIWIHAHHATPTSGSQEMTRTRTAAAVSTSLLPVPPSPCRGCGACRSCPSVCGICAHCSSPLTTGGRRGWGQVTSWANWSQCQAVRHAFWLSIRNLLNSATVIPTWGFSLANSLNRANSWNQTR